MGLLSKFKEFFNKNIECGDEIDDHILVFLKGKKYLYFGKNIIVRDGTSCVVVYKNRVCDVLLPGKYKIGADTIPECYSRAKIDKLKSKGANVKKIRVKLFYVNTTEFKDFDFTSKTPFVVKSKDLGRVKGCLCGRATIRAIDPLLLVKYLINNSRKVNDKTANLLISNLIGNKINKVFDKCKIPFEMLFTDREKVNAVLNTEVEDVFDKRGLFVKNIILKSVDVAKKHQEKVNAYISSRKRNVSMPKIIDKALGIGESFRIPINVNIRDSVNDKICKRCGASMPKSSEICVKCGNRLN